MPCKGTDNIFEPCPILHCQCEGCDGKLTYTGNNVSGTLAFLDCPTCGCASVATVTPYKRLWGGKELCYQKPDTPGMTARCAIHDEVPDWGTELGYAPGWYCPSGTRFRDP